MSKKKKQATLQGYGGFVLTFEPERTEWLARHLSRRLQLTESFSAEDWDLEPRELVFLVLEERPYTIAAFGLMEYMYGSGGFRKTKMRMTQMHIFDDPISEREFQRKGFGELICTPERMDRLTPERWVSLLADVKNVRPQDVDAIEGIAAQRVIERRILGDSRRVERLNEQRDALGLALDIADVDRLPILQSMETRKIGEAKSILDLLDHLPIHERSMVEHDARVFEALLGEAPTRSMTFANKSGRSVRVLVVDKTDLETALGIDLIVYQLRYENFLLLQYKRMDKVEGGWSYPVPATSDVHRQLGQMRTFMATANAQQGGSPPTLWSYRLNDDPFYFKFCEQFRADARDSSLVPGITMSACHLDEFLALPEACGERGGVSVGYDNCPRYLTNTDFTQLARSGWIGAGRHSVALMKQVLEANAKSGRTAMLTVIDAPKDTSAAGRDWKG